MKDTPQLKSLIKNDTGAFMCAWLPAIFAIIAVGAFIYFESSRDNYSILEITYIAPLLFISLALSLWPFILWWWHSVSTTFKNGVELEAKNTNKIIKRAFDLGIIYTFEYQGAKFEHIASLVPNKETKEIAAMQPLLVVFNPKNKISFIKNAYI